MPNYRNVATALRPDTAPLRVRFGIVQSIQADRTITLTVGGSTETIAGVRYSASMTPCPGKSVFCLTDGVDLFAVDHMAAAELTLAPRAYRSSNLSIANATDTAVTWAGANSDEWDTWVSASPTLLSAPITGRFMATAFVEFAGDADGFRQAWVRKNGADVVGYVKQLSAASGSPTNMTVATPAFDLTKGDYIELVVRHNAGNAIDLIRDGTLTPALSLIYIGP